MYNKIKCNFIDETCPCEFVVSRDERFQYDYIDIEIYIGEGLENIEARAWCYTYGAEWTLPEVIGEGDTGYHNGWYWTRLRYSDFAKCAEGDQFIEVRVYANDEQIGGKGGWLYIYHESIGGDFSTNPVIVTKMQDVSILNSYRVVGIGSSGGSGGGGGGGGGGTTYTPGNGIDISENEIRAKIDGSTIKFNSNGEMYAETGEKNQLTIENAVILKEDQAAYILHKYSEISYVSGQRAIWSTIGSSVICQGMAVSDNYALSFQSSKPTLDEAFPNGQPSYYTSGKIITVASATAEPVTTLWEMYLESYSQNRYYYRIKYSRDGGTTWPVYSNRYISWYVPSPGIYLSFSGITATADNARPNGYITVQLNILYQNNIAAGAAYQWVSSSVGILPSNIMIFANEAEKNAAIALRYEPQKLTTVIDTKEATG